MLTLNETQLNLFFPFYFRIDKDWKIDEIGISLAHLFESPQEFSEQLFVIENGNKIRISELEIVDGQSVDVVVKVRDQELDLEGVFVQSASGYIFLGAPVLRDSEKLKKRRVHQLDFGFTNPTVELLNELDNDRFIRSEMKEVSDQLMTYHEELIDTTARLNSLLESLDSAILSESGDRKIVVVNELFCKLFKMPGQPKDFVGMDCSQAAEYSKSMFKDPEAFVSGIDKLIKSKERVTGELLYLNDGRILERDFIPVFEQGIYAGHTWKYQDVTEILYNKRVLVKTEDKYSRIIENLKFGLVEVDLNEVITKVYPAFCALTGYSEAELIGQNAKELLALKEDFEDSEELNEMRKEGVINVYERRIRRKDGKIIYLIISGAPIYNDQNKIVGSMGIHVDITDRKLMEQDLISAKEAALSSMHAKEMFLANMSHEIRTPMNVIIGMTELLQETSMNTDQSNYLDAVKTSADNLLALINDILDFSKIEAGHLDLEETPSSIHELFKQVQLSFTDLARKKGIDFICNVEGRVAPSLIFDKNKLNQVVINLVSNAIKFTEKGAVQIEARILSDNLQEQLVEFKIKDSGIGIDKSNHEQIFSTFIQEDSGISRKFGGTGLGLSISRSIIRKMGGDIQVKSEKGMGSEFSFKLTFSKASSNDEQVSIQGSESSFGNTRILVAEDNELNRLLITSVLNKEKIFHRIAENGRQAIEFLQNDHYDLILMDIQMPEMDGISATKEIRELLNSTIPIVALSANASADDTRKYLAVGMNAHVPKPFKKEQLFAVLREVLQLDVTNPVREGEKEEKNAVLYSTDELLQIGGGDQQFVLSVLQTFVTTVPVQMGKLESAINGHDEHVAKSIAHQLKPSIDLLHIYSAKELVRQIEKESTEPSPDFEKMKGLFAKFSIELKRVLHAIHSELGQ